MTKHQLNNLFDHFHLPRIYGKNEISELKKLLLLELKSLDNQTILIGKDVWTKSDAIQFFDSPLIEGFDVPVFYEKYPWAELITTPEKIVNTRGITLDSFEDPLFENFRLEVAVHFENSFLKLMKELMSARKYSQSSTMFHYLGCFQFEFQNNVLTILRSMMNTRLKTVSVNMQDSGFKDKENELRFLKQHGYYSLLKQIGDSDSELILQNLDTFSTCLNHMSVQNIKSIIKQQRQLPLPPNGIHFLDEIQRQVDTILNRQKVTSNSSSEGSTFKTIGTVLSIVIGLIVAISRCNRNNHQHVDITEMQRYQQQFQDIQRQNQVQVEDLGDSLRIIRNGDTMYTKQRSFFNQTSDTTY